MNKYASNIFLCLMLCVLATACSAQPSANEALTPNIQTETAQSMTIEPEIAVNGTPEPEDPSPSTKTSTQEIPISPSTSTPTITPIVLTELDDELLLERRLWSLGFYETGLVDGRR